jgi:enoyl-[acyl-carrier protein] reductase I
VNVAGKNVVVLGVGDESSIAWTIARAFADREARVHIGYQQRFFSRVRLLLRDFPAIQGARCDVLQDAELTAFFDRFRDDPIDVLVHSIAYGPPEAFTEEPSAVSREALAQTLEVSASSLATVVRYAKPNLREWSSVITLTFQASSRAMPLYGMMGVAKATLESLVRYLALELGGRRVRVNAISAGAIQTVAATGEVLAFMRNPEALRHTRGSLLLDALEEAEADCDRGRDELEVAREVWKRVQARFARRSCIECLVTQQDVAGAALFLGSDLARKITAQVIHVDMGLSASTIW